MKFELVARITFTALVVGLPVTEISGLEIGLNEVNTLIQEHCIACHNEDESNGSVNLSGYGTLASVKRDVQLWEKIADVVSQGEMPPDDGEAMSRDDRDLIAYFVKQVVDDVITAGQSDLVPNAPRRLTRREYANTIRDLLGVEVDADAFLPEDKVGATGFRNDINELNISPELLERYFMLAEKAVNKAIVRDASTSDKRLMIAVPSEDISQRGVTKQIINAFSRKAFRRPANGKELQPYISLASSLEAAGASFEFSIASAAKAILVSPQFLFRIESADAAPGVSIVNDFEFATRLSYLVWSSCPDEELLRQAEQKRLHKPSVLAAQIQRMLADDRAEMIADEFVDQWLFSRVTAREPDPVVFPTYSREINDAAIREMRYYVTNLFRENRSLLDLIDSDYTFVNHTLAQHYGLEGSNDDEWRRVALLPKDNRGGLLGMSRVLQRTSMSDRTSPTVRGAWVLDAMLGTPPPPPPPDVNNTIDQNSSGEERALTLRAKLEAHANDGTSCARCHKKMDPIGFAMDNYDGIGRWRNDEQGQPLDTSGIMANGRKLSGINDLKLFLGERKLQFTRNIVKQFLTYALGRELTAEDFSSLQTITQQVVDDDYRARTLIVAVASSYPFNHKKYSITHSGL